MNYYWYMVSDTKVCILFVTLQEFTVVFHGPPNFISGRMPKGG
jgi:hypothetical protein